jgi:hypothetical protein
VRSWNTAGDFSRWSTVWTIKIAYDLPSLVSPALGSTVGSLKPAFTWNLVPGVTSYNFQVSADPTFKTFLLNVNAKGTSYTPVISLTAHKTLYWRVRALGTYGPGAWSAKWSFITP